ncbi:MFS transporter [Saccharopolyspora sp. NPDC050389]|uniref:MFS transporter n=1 Tax=Saccharopolyspora sp. NPDC050389 TaxID=3155516 RepID=UPI0033D58B21
MTTYRTASSWMPAAAAVFTAGWGANQFAPLAVVYRTERHWRDIPVAAMFTTYLFGLLPGLLLGGPASDQRGRRIVRPALALSAVASALLSLAPVSQFPVYASRLAAGVAAGVVLSAGTTWIVELSADLGRPSAGPRRAMNATGGGLAAGALVAGILAQWSPWPAVFPALVHTVLALLCLAATWKVPETAPSPVTVAKVRHVRGVGRSATRHPRFLRVVLPASPAVFAAATVAYVVLPPLLADRVPGYAPLFSGLVTALTLATGIAVQPLARLLDHAGNARATLAGMATVIAGLLLGSYAVYQGSVVLTSVAALLLGAGYGLTSASGLRELERLTPPSALPSTVSLYHGTTYLGFLTPLFLAVTAGAAPYPALLAGMAAAGLLFLSITAWHSRSHLPHRISGELKERKEQWAE